MKFDKQLIWIRILSLLGLALSVKLAIIFYSANYDKYALSSFCSVNDFIDCDGVAKTTTSVFCGVPLAYWGIFFYLTVLFLTFVDKLKSVKFLKFLEVFREPKAYITVLGTVAFMCSMVLAGLSLFKIHKICVLCVATYFVDFIIALIASNGLFKNIIKNYKITFVDFIDGVKKYTKTFITLLVLVSSFLLYSGITLNFVPHMKHRRDIIKYKKIKYNPYRINGNVLGSEKADVVIHLYSDYVCPLCYINNIMLHQAAKEYGNIKIVHYNFPFDKYCNPTIEFTMHPYACFMSKVAIAAGKQGNYWGMSSLLYENRPKNVNKAVELVEKLGLDTEKFIQDVESLDVNKILEKDVSIGSERDIDATPTMFIDDEKIVGVKPYYELKRILEKHGAKRK